VNDIVSKDSLNIFDEHTQLIKGYLHSMIPLATMLHNGTSNNNDQTEKDIILSNKWLLTAVNTYISISREAITSLEKLLETTIAAE
jgi:hypothetical protein